MQVAIDVGYSAVKAKAGSVTCLFPSVVGTPLPATTFSVKRNQRALAVSNNGHFTPVGETALLQSKYVSGRRDPEWVLGDEWLTLFQAALSELITAPYALVDVVIGLPIKDYGRFERQLRDRVKQMFVFRRVGKEPQKVSIENCVVVTQPYGALLDMALNDRGEIQNNVWASGRTAIGDIGGNTFNLQSVSEFDEIPGETTSEEFGLLHALDEVRDALRANFTHFNPETHEVSEWLAAGKFRHGGQDYDIWPYAEPYLMPLVDIVMTKVHDVWRESGRFDATLLSGGGAAILGRYIKERMSGEFANVQIASDPRWCNVRGYYKLALREFAGG